MTKKMQNIEMVNIANGVTEFIQKEKAIPVKVSYAISKNISKLMEELKPYEEERKKLMEGFDDKPENEKKEVMSKLEELLKIENEVDVHTIQMQDIETCECITTKEFMLLEFMIENN